MKTNILVLYLLISSIALAQPHSKRYVPETDPLVLQKLEQWQDLKFGLLMHWGPYSQWGVVESWSICSEDVPWCRRSMDDYCEYKRQYENLKTTFNPTNFDPDKWARAAKAAGMKYVVFTTKHHDGFCMFDTKTTDYKITGPGCPFSSGPRANVTKEIFDAFRKQGLWTGAYFSKPDWHSEYYWWPYFATPDRNVNYSIEKHPDRWQKFVEFTHEQVLELMSDYGPVDILWLDGGWVQKRSKEEILKNPGARLQNQDIKLDELVQGARTKQPGLIVVDRAVHGKNQNYLTPENRIPDQVILDPWESCIISGGGWSYTPNAVYKSGRELVHTLVDIVAKGGNLLLNIGPGPDGTWADDAYDRLQKIGDWLAVNGEAIYGTRPVEPYLAGRLRFTQKSEALYAVYLAAESEEQPPATITLPNLNSADGARIRMLGVDADLSYKKSDNGLVVAIPQNVQNQPPCHYAWTLKISR